MNKSVLISIQPKSCELIASGKKTIEVRKTAPKLETPFKCYIYQSHGKKRDYFSRQIQEYFNQGKVIGEFVCDRISKYNTNCFDGEDSLKTTTCLDDAEIMDYVGYLDKSFYLWYITDLKIYDKPKELWEFNYLCTGKKCSKCQYEVREELPFGKIGVCCGRYHITRPFQSWGYVEELSE